MLVLSTVNSCSAKRSFGTWCPLSRHLFVNKILIAQEYFLIIFTDVPGIIIVIVMLKGATVHDNTERGNWWI